MTDRAARTITYSALGVYVFLVMVFALLGIIALCEGWRP